MNNVFGLDIGTRNVVGTVGHRTEDGAFIVEAQYVRQHETRSMLDGQIHDIGKVARTISAVKAERSWMHRFRKCVLQPPAVC